MMSAYKDVLCCMEISVRKQEPHQRIPEWSRQEGRVTWVSMKEDGAKSSVWVVLQVQPRGFSKWYLWDIMTMKLY